MHMDEDHMDSFLAMIFKYYNKPKLEVKDGELATRALTYLPPSPALWLAAQDHQLQVGVLNGV